MNMTIEPCRLRGRVSVPASKSMAHRALIAAALADQPTELWIHALNEDISATIGVLNALGAEISVTPEGRVCVRPLGINRYQDMALPELDCGESGSTLRFMLPVACALGASARFIGRGRLPQRPMKPLTDALRAHGALVEGDALPLTVSGKIGGGLWTLPGDVSSQYITGLLLALPLLQEDSEISLTSPLQSVSYVAMTLSTLRDFDIRVAVTADGWIVPGGQRPHSPGFLKVEGDWSAAAFWHAANAMGAEIQIDGAPDDSLQGDRVVLNLLGQPEIHAEDVPDLVPALAAAAAVKAQRTVISGAARLRLKESDRIKATVDMIRALGGRAEETADGLIVHGGQTLHGGTVNGFNDHRIVMAAAILAARAEGPVVITDAEAVNKSYPDFFSHFRALGGIARE